MATDGTSGQETNECEARGNSETTLNRCWGQVVAGSIVEFPTTVPTSAMETGSKDSKFLDDIGVTQENTDTKVCARR